MVLESTQLNTVHQFAAHKFQTVGEELTFFFVQIGQRTGAKGDFAVCEVMAFDKNAKTEEECLASVKLVSISASQAQIDSFLNGRLDKKTGQRTTEPVMVPGKFYTLKYTSAVGTKYKDKKGVERETTSAGYSLFSLTLKPGAEQLFRNYLQTQDIKKSVQAQQPVQSSQEIQVATHTDLPEL